MLKISYWDFNSGNKVQSGHSEYLISEKSEKFIELKRLSDDFIHKMKTETFLDYLNSDRIRLC